MYYFHVVVDAIVTWLKIEFTIYGYTLSLWAILCYVLIASFVLWLLFKLFDWSS